MDRITAILVYKFTDISRQEIEAMLGLDLQQARVYQEAKAEGREERHQEGHEYTRLSLSRSRDELLNQFRNPALPQ